jgi:glycosyltransferase involved in cell wall biosynthesis
MEGINKKIFYLTTTNINSSTATANRAVALLNSLVASNFEVTVIHATLNNLDNHPERDDAKFSKIFFASKRKLKFLNLLLLISIFFKILEVIRKNKGVIIYSYGFHILDISLSSISKLLFGNPVIREFTEHPSYNNKISFITTIKTKIAFYFSNYIFVISNNLQEFVTSYSNKPVSILNMVVDTERFSIKTQHPEDIITYCGTIESEKDGIKILFETFEIFKRNVNFKDYKLQIIADTRNKVKYDDLVKLATNLKIIDSIIFTGKVGGAEIPKYLSKSKLLVLSRENNQQAKYGFPTKLGEYIASGVPTLCTDVGNISEFISDELNGFIVQPNNPKIFANKMISIFDNYEKSIKIAKKGMDLLIVDFNPKEQVKKIIYSIDQIEPKWH